MLSREEKRKRREAGDIPQKNPKILPLSEPLLPPQPLQPPLPPQELVKLRGSLDDVTLIIKAFERPLCLDRLIKSIDQFYPNIKIIVADDSREIFPISRKNFSRIVLPFNTGISYGKNRALFAVKTPYAVVLDDDFIFTEKTQLEIWLDILESSSIDLVGGDVQGFPHYEACLNEEEFKNGIVHFEKRNKGNEYGCPLFDITLSFWMGKTEAIKKFGAWDDEFKVVEHSVFFLRAFNKIKIAYCDRVKIDHSHTRKNSSENYEKLKNEKANYFFNLILEKFNLQKFIGPTGNTLARKTK